MPVRYRFVRQKAADLLRKAKVRTAPIDVDMLAHLVDADVHREPFPEDDVCGMVHRRPDGTAVIGVNSLHAETRQRFTIGHELGHLVLNHKENTHVDARIPIAFRDELSKQAIDPDEIEANQFAAEVLMPSELLRKDLHDMKLDIEDEKQIRELAKKYNVSMHAMTIRLSSIGGTS